MLEDLPPEIAELLIEATSYIAEWKIAQEEEIAKKRLDVQMHDLINEVGTRIHVGNAADRDLTDMMGYFCEAVTALVDNGGPSPDLFTITPDNEIFIMWAYRSDRKSPLTDISVSITGTVDSPDYVPVTITSESGRFPYLAHTGSMDESADQIIKALKAIRKEQLDMLRVSSFPGGDGDEDSDTALGQFHLTMPPQEVSLITQLLVAYVTALSEWKNNG